MNTLQEDATAMLETIDAKKHERLSPGDRALIFQLYAKDIQQAEIARIVGCHASTVCRALKLVDTRLGARMILNSKAADMAQHVVSTGDAEIHRKVLTQLEVLPEKGSGGTQVVVGVLGCQIPPEQLEAMVPQFCEIEKARATRADHAPGDAAA